MTCAAVPRAGRTPASLAQSQGARGSAHSQSRSVQPRRRAARAWPGGRAHHPAAAPAQPSPAGGPREPRGCGQGPGEGAPQIYGAPASPAGSGEFSCRQGHAGGASLMRCRAPGPAHLLGCPAASGRTLGRQGPGLHLCGPLGPAPILSPLLPQPPLCLSRMQIYAAKAER